MLTLFGVACTDTPSSDPDLTPEPDGSADDGEGGNTGAGDEPGSNDTGGTESLTWGLPSDYGIVFEKGLLFGPGDTTGADCTTCTVKNGITLGSGLDVLNGVDLSNADDLGNGIVGPHYAPPPGSDLEQWLDADPLMNQRVLRYLVECALPEGIQVQLLYRGELSVVGEGLLGLGPSLASGEMPVEEQEWVSACLIARQNGLERSLLVELRGPHANLSQAIAENDSREAVYFGNVFAEMPVANVIHNAPVTAIRACADKNRQCGLVTPFYDNYTTTCGPYDGQTAEYCFGDGGYSTRVITVFFPSQVDGASCNYFMECDSLRCVNQVCTPRLESGQACQGDTDCTTGICDGDICTAGAVGDRCDGHWNCSTPYCGAGVCTDGQSGDPCDTTDDCRTGVCKNTGSCK